LYGIVNRPNHFFFRYSSKSRRVANILRIYLSRAQLTNHICVCISYNSHEHGNTVVSFFPTLFFSPLRGNGSINLDPNQPPIFFS
jgi:hypothetical protein